MPSPITGPGSMNTPNNVQAPGMQGTLFNSPTVPESSNVPAIAAPAPLATPESVQAGNMAAPGGNAAAKTIGTTQVNAGMAP